MAVEMLYNAIRLDGAGEIAANITQSDGSRITEGDVKLTIPSLGIEIKGKFEDGYWNFTLPEVEAKGRYHYKFTLNGESLDFGAPIYLL